MEILLDFMFEFLLVLFGQFFLETRDSLLKKKIKVKSEL